MEKLQKQDIVKMITIIQKTYVGAYKFEKEDDLIAVIDVWQSCFEDYDRLVVFDAFKKCLKYCTKAPVIADIIKQIDLIELANSKSDQELWSELDKQSMLASFSIERFDYTYIPEGETKTQGDMAREEVDRLYNGLDPLIKEYLGNSKKRFIDIARMTQDEIQYDMARFLRLMPEIRQRKKIKEEQSHDVFEQLGESAIKMIEGEK